MWQKASFHQRASIKAVVPDFFWQFTLFGPFEKWNYPQIKSYDLSTQNVYRNTCNRVQNIKIFKNEISTSSFLLILLGFNDEMCDI